jgi:hypothetical protein
MEVELTRASFLAFFAAALSSRISTASLSSLARFSSVGCVVERVTDMVGDLTKELELLRC